MIFQQRRKKKQTEEHSAPEKFVYFLSQEKDANMDLWTKRVFFTGVSAVCEALRRTADICSERKRRYCLFFQGLCLPFFTSYLSDISEDFFNREAFFYGYQQPFTPSNDYHTESQRNELYPWELHAYFDELHGNLLLYIKTPYVAEHVIALAQQICGKCGKELHISCG